MRTGRFVRTSLVRPPNVDVIIPQSAERGRPTPARTPFMAPMQQNTPMPIESARNTQKSSSESWRRSAKVSHMKNVRTQAATEIQKYSCSSIQNARLGTPFSCASRKSRMVPPPVAVIVPTTVHPSRSIPVDAAVSVPVMAKTAVPNQSPARSSPPAVQFGYLAKLSGSIAGSSTTALEQRACREDGEDPHPTATIWGSMVLPPHLVGLGLASVTMLVRE
mmetsp:Transcript_10635/g.20629  ORF Transcript_10635/g.20629 Transcript_10635/m.20629 type:complete len:220 (+) Transcript_10635:50-709(+)